MIKRVLKWAIPILAAISVSCVQTKPNTFQCSDHSWDSVQDMVFPYLDEYMQTAMIMQAQSSNYKAQMAADFALAIDESYPDSIVVLLKNIESCKMN